MDFPFYKEMTSAKMNLKLCLTRLHVQTIIGDPAMKYVEEINHWYDPNTYFTSSVNIQSRKNKNKGSTDNNRRKRLAPGSYNLTQIESTLHGTGLTEDLVEEKNSLKRFGELDKENYGEGSRIDLPKNGMTFQYQQSRQPTSLSASKNLKRDHVATVHIKQSYLTSVRKILSSRRQLSNYLDEDEKNSSILHNVVSKRHKTFIVPNKKLCSICGDASPGSCTKCGLRVCSVKCSVVHNETRCSGY